MSGTAFAAEIDTEDPIVWLNGQNNQLEASFSDIGDKEYDVKIESVEGSLSETVKQQIDSESELNLTTEEIKNNLEGELSVGEYKLILDPKSGEDVEESIFVRRFEAEVEADGSGSGFVNKRLGSDGTGSMILDIKLKDVSNDYISAQSLSDFSAPDLEGFEDQLKIEDPNVGESLNLILGPEVEDNIANEMPLNFNFTVNESTVQKELDVNPDIYEFEAVPVGERPSALSSFKNIKRNFSYNLDMVRYGEDVGVDLGDSDVESPLDNSADRHNFNLDINLLSEDGTDYDNDGQVLLSVDDLSGSAQGDYRVELSQIPDLETGVYEFETFLEYDDEKVLIDSIRVRKGLDLSGQVMDSMNRGIEMNMVLNQQGTANTIPVETDPSGYYSKEIPNPNSQYDATMRFFDTVSSSRSYSDGRVNVEGIDFSSGENQDFAGDQQAVKFEYWQEPEVELEAINPINMMAVKFGYPIDSEGHTASMKFNPSGVNTDEIKVYRCSQWNFLGTECLGEWSEISGDLSINYQAWRANFDIEEPYRASNAEGGAQNILMNAYIVGTSADLVLTNGVSISGTDGGRVETGGQVEVTGRVSSENENFVESAEVDIKFLEGSEEIHTFDTVETDSEGRFTASGDAPEDPGNYTVEVEADATNYDGFERTFEDRFETFIAEGIDLDVDETFDVTLGEEASMTFEVENTGQTDMESIDLSFSGLNSDFYSVSDSSFSSIDSGDSRTVEINFDIPETYGIESYPELDIDVSAENSEGQEFSSSESVQTQLSMPSRQGTDEQEESSEQTDETNDSSSFSSGDVAEMTGEFIESQSSLNIALGMILVFMMVVAGAISKKKDDQDDRRSRPQVQKPFNKSEGSKVKKDLTGGSKQDQEEPDEVDNQIDEIADAFEESEEDQKETEEESTEDQGESEQDKTEEDREEDSDSEENDNVSETGFVCEVCGENFDSESGRSLHQSVMHED